jgi:hypothetical protein
VIFERFFLLYLFTTDPGQAAAVLSTYINDGDILIYPK